MRIAIATLVEVGAVGVDIDGALGAKDIVLTALPASLSVALLAVEPTAGAATAFDLI